MGLSLNISAISAVQRRLIANALVAIQFITLGALGIVDLADFEKRTLSYLPTEIILILLGILVIAGAWFSLRPSLRISPIPKEHSPLVETGIYRRVRHPMYLGVILIGFGMAGFADSPLAWVLEILLIVNLNVKSRYEDALLLEIHPDALHYQMHVSRLLPCLGASCKTNCALKDFER